MTSRLPSTPMEATAKLCSGPTRRTAQSWTAATISGTWFTRLMPKPSPSSAAWISLSSVVSWLWTRGMSETSSSREVTRAATAWTTTVSRIPRMAR